jgi:uncharacterized protein YdhG (YjbR/CyaY superfamily)
MSVDEYIFNLNENEKRIAQFLRSEILNLAMGVEEKIAYGLPYFTYLGPLCYLAPKKVGVDLGFMDGQQFVVTKQYLNTEGRKRVGGIFYESLESIDFDILRQTLVEAIEFNQNKKKKKR